MRPGLKACFHVPENGNNWKTVLVGPFPSILAKSQSFQYFIFVMLHSFSMIVAVPCHGQKSNEMPRLLIHVRDCTRRMEAGLPSCK